MDFTGGASDPTSPGSQVQNVSAEAEPSEIGNGELQVLKEAKNPLEIDVVLRNLYSWFEREELVPFRLVSRQWERIVTPLVKQGDLFLLFDRPFQKTRFVKRGCDSDTMTLEKFNSFLSTTKTENPDWNFLLVNFQFFHGNLGSLESQEFFQLYGQNIKRLSLNLSNESEENTGHTSIFTFRRILLEQANNLQELELWDIPEEWCEESAFELFPEPRNTIQLPKLTKLWLHNSTFTHAKSHRLVQDLIQAAVNLKEIQGYKIQFLDPAASALENKIHAVKDLDFAPKNDNEEQTLDLYAKFAEGRPKLVELTISLHDLNFNSNPESAAKIVQLLQMILESSKDTLESILNCPPLSHLPRLKLPPMKKVKDIHFTDHKQGVIFPWLNQNEDENANEFLPRPLKLREIFPNLDSLEIDFLSLQNPAADDGLWLSYFDYSASQALDSVTHLEVKGELCPEFVEQLASVFPQVKNLIIWPRTIHFQQNMWTIWREFSNVQNLEIIIYKSSRDSFRNFREIQVITEEMDAGITGFSPETCVQLKTNSRNMKIEDVDALRENPSILNAKKLEQFTIEFKREGCLFDFRRPVFSLVTGIFGFDAVKKKSGVNVSVINEGATTEELQEALAEAAYYVDFVTDKDNK